MSSLPADEPAAQRPSLTVVVRPAHRDVGSRDVAGFARAVWSSNDPAVRLRRGIELVAELVEGCDHAAVSVMTSGRLDAGPATDSAGGCADRLQHELDDGPCLEVLRTGASVASEDLVAEQRWPRWTSAVVERVGVRAAMSLMLCDDSRVYGSLNLYSDRADAWSSSEVVLAQVLATHLSLALGDALQIEHRGRAMVSRTVIGQAQGVLMERFNITSERAYAVLKRVSQQDHVKLVTVAEDLVRTARLPGSIDHVRTPPSDPVAG